MDKTRSGFALRRYSTVKYRPTDIFRTRYTIICSLLSATRDFRLAASRQTYQCRYDDRRHVPQDFANSLDRATPHHWLPRRACTVPVCPATVTVLWVLPLGTAGYCRYCRYCTVPAGAKVTVGYCGSTRGYCRVLWVLWVLQELK